MRKDIHPEVNSTTIRCTCGFQVDTLSTKGGEIEVEICSNCHPFYTGKMKLVDSAGRVDKFKNRYKKHYERRAREKNS